MFNLMAETDCIPVEEENIVQIHKGMNKLRVSLGEHVSEPSEVYIVTGDDGGLLRSFIVFYVVEPEIHVVYEYEGNPYSPEGKEEVLKDAFRFVEEMGAILEEVPWEDMSPEERMIWTGNVTLYPQDARDEEIGIIDELEEIRPGELLEVLEGVEPEEIEDAGIETDEPDGGEDTPEETTDGSEVESRDGDEDDLIDEDQDFEQLLKQAFLKPDLVEKSSVRKPSREEDEPPDADEPDDEENPDRYPEGFEEAAADSEIDETGTIVEMFEEPEDEPIFDTGKDERPEATDAIVESSAVKADFEPSIPGSRSGLAIIRFLSRF